MTTKVKKPLRLYYDFVAQPTRAVYILLSASGKPFAVGGLKVLEGEYLTDEFRREVNRFQKVPAYVNDETKWTALAESIAILRYLHAKSLISDKFYPREENERLLVDYFLQWQHSTIRSSCSLYYRFHWLEESVFGAPAAAKAAAKYKLQMEHDLQLLEEFWLTSNKFVAGERLTAADVFGACEVEHIRITGYKVAEKFPKVAKWIEAVRMECQPHFHVAHQKVYLLEQETLKKKKFMRPSAYRRYVLGLLKLFKSKL